MIWYFLRHLTWSLFLLTFVFTFNCEGQFHQIFARGKHFHHFFTQEKGFPSCASVEIFRSAFLKELLLSFILFSTFYLIHFSYYWLYTVYYYFCEFFWNAAGLFLSSFNCCVYVFTKLWNIRWIRICEKLCSFLFSVWVQLSPPPLSV